MVVVSRKPGGVMKWQLWLSGVGAFLIPGLGRHQAALDVLELGGRATAFWSDWPTCQPEFRSY